MECICSVLDREVVSQEQVRGDVTNLLSSIFEFIDRNKWLDKLPYSISPRKETPTRSPRDRVKQIFNHDFNEHATLTLLNENLDRWENEISTFFQLTKPKSLVPTVPLHHILGDPEIRLVVFCLQLEQSDAHSQILRRIVCIVLHRIRRTYAQNRSPTLIAKAIYDSLHIDDENRNLDSLVASTESMINGGPTYDAIGLAKGYGTICVLGTVVTRTIWEKRLPNSGELFNDAMTHLTSCGAEARGKRCANLVLNGIEYLQKSLPKQPVFFVQTKRTTPPTSRSPGPKRSRCGIPSHPTNTNLWISSNLGDRGASAAANLVAISEAVDSMTAQNPVSTERSFTTSGIVAPSTASLRHRTNTSQSPTNGMDVPNTDLLMSGNPDLGNRSDQFARQTLPPRSTTSPSQVSSFHNVSKGILPPPRTMSVTMLCSEGPQRGIQGEGSPEDHRTLLPAMDRMAVSAITTPTGSLSLPGSRYETEPPFGTVTNFAGDHGIPTQRSINLDVPTTDPQTSDTSLLAHSFRRFKRLQSTQS